MTHLSATEVAQLIRRDLKVFKGVKFSVRSSYYSMGSSIQVSWTDGPTKAQVEYLIGKYEGKGFDGSIDATYYHKHYRLQDGTIIYGGTRGSGGMVEAVEVAVPEGAEEVSISCTVNTSRSFSPAFAERCLERARRYWGSAVDGVTVFRSKFDGTAWFQSNDSEADRKVYQMANKTGIITAAMQAAR